MIAVTGPAEAQSDFAATVRTLIAGAHPPGYRAGDSTRYVDAAARLYAPRADGPVWMIDGRVSTQGRAAIDALLAAALHGIDPGNYDAQALDAMARRLDRGAVATPDLARIDVWLSISLLRYLDNLRFGRVRFAPFIRRSADRPDWSALDRAAAGDSIPQFVAAAAPPLTQYRNLQRLLVRYRRLAVDPPLPMVPIGPTVVPGQPYAGADALRRRLVVTDAMADTAGGTRGEYDDSLVEGVRRFQVVHGLDPDGILGPRTVEALNTPFDHRVHQIELALERLRWLPPLGQRPFLVVNIPAFELFAFDSTGGTGAPSLMMKVVLGKALDTRTPMLFEQMRYVEFRPYWNVPRSILMAEILPTLRRDPSYLRAHEMEFYGPGAGPAGDHVNASVIRRLAADSLWVRQRPGPSNSLGLIKFAFPNAAAVYMHGTPETVLFARSRRDFSHGCIRLEDPAALGAWVLRDQAGMTRDSIAAAMNGDSTYRVTLTRPLAVAVFYTTAVAMPDGTARFYPDVYGLDRELTEALARVAPLRSELR